MELTYKIVVFVISSLIKLKSLHVIPVKTAAGFLFGYSKLVKLSVLIGNNHGQECRNV